jgi:ketohexokinase
MRILAVGIATLDIINTVAHYPDEDEEVRILHQKFERGGNATNSLVVLSQLGHACSWAGTICDEPDSRLILEDLQQYGIDVSFCRHYSHGKVPTSYILLSKATGSRTIVHYRELPEYQASDFENIDITQFDWLHFEGRNVIETEKMLRLLKRSGLSVPISLEVEKPRQAIERLYPFADVLLFSRAYSLSLDCRSPAELFAKVRQANRHAQLFCAWGAEGAWSQTAAGNLYHAPAVAQRVVDTLAAGDVFNAGVIHGILQKQAPKEILTKAVRLAGDKCEQSGLAGLIIRYDSTER